MRNLLKQIGSSKLQRILPGFRSFSIRNQGKRLNPKGITRPHGQFYYDEYFDLKTNLSELNRMSKAENAKHDEVVTKFQHIYSEYYGVSSKRTDPRSKELPEVYD